MKALGALLLLTTTALAGDPGSSPGQALPDPKLTPGLANPSLTIEVICAKGWSTKTVRDVSSQLKRQVYARYGMGGPRRGYCAVPEGCEVDHLISLTIGGSNDIRNLWPQLYPGVWGAHAKDRLEVHLHKLVCSGTVTLEQAQSEISHDWIAAHRKYLGQTAVMR
jgi:hypothetical protein